MESIIGIEMTADPDTVFALAAAVEDWPRILPHYRWVRRLEGDDRLRTVEMAARREFGPLAYPVRWTAVVEPLPAARRLRFTHIAGPTRGMEVEWRLTPRDGGTHVAIWHRFRSRIPLVGELYAEYIASRIFIHHIAGRTLRCMKGEAERQAGRRGRPAGMGTGV